MNKGRAIGWLVLMALMAPLVVLAAPGDITRLHVEGSQQARTLWIVQVLEGEKPELRYSEVFARTEHQPTWQLVSRIPGTVLDVTRYRGDLALVLRSGEWLILNQASGRSLPGDLRMSAVAGDEDSLWAIGVMLQATR